MSNKKPVLTVVIRDNHAFSAEEFCTAVATSVVWFVDEVNAGYNQSKHEVALRNWELTGRRIQVRLASEDQWWSFLLADGMSDRIGDMYFHVFPPMPANLLPDFIRYCPNDTFNPRDEFDLEPRETDIRLPLYSIVLEENPKVNLVDYATSAANLALTHLDLSMKKEEEYTQWSRNNFALNVGIVNQFDPIIEPDLMIEDKGIRKVNAMGLWVQ
jgi:hypothetical protein